MAGLPRVRIEVSLRAVVVEAVAVRCCTNVRSNIGSVRPNVALDVNLRRGGRAEQGQGDCCNGFHGHPLNRIEGALTLSAQMAGTCAEHHIS